MKNIFLISLLMITFVIMGKAQSNNGNRIKAIAQVDNNSIKVRWMLTDYETWIVGNQVGYSLTRYTTYRNGEQLSFAEMQASLVTLESNIIPLVEGQWDSSFSDNPFGQVAKGALYEPDNSVIITGTPTLADAYNKVESNDARFLFGLFAAEQDFAVAEAMALAYEDNNIDATEIYLYQLNMNSTNPSFNLIQTMISVDAGEVTVLPIIEVPYGLGEDKAVILQWDMIGTTDNYSTYDVEKSIDGVNYEKVNKLPFVFGAEGVDDPKVAVFKDKLDDNTTTYHYRVRGRTPFGTQGPPSQSVALKGMPPRINIYPVLSDYMEDEAAGVRLLWNAFEADLQNQVAEFNIYRSQQSNKNFVKINTAAITATETSFSDATPFNTAYYKLEAVDINGYTYTSPSLLVQLKDEAPPAIPVGLSGRFLTSTTLELTWDENTEEDLKGYRLFVANKAGAVFTQITSNAVKDNRYIYEVNTQFSVAEIYIKILATDLRDNYSAKSEAIAIARPDVIPPSKPVLYKAIPTPAGIEFGFKFSSSEDRKRHILQFKAQDTPGWEDALSIKRDVESDYLTNLTPNAITSTHYVLPNQDLERRPYMFRMLAEDEKGNISSSQILTIRPYHSGVRGGITDFDVYLTLTPTETDTENPHIIINELLAAYEAEEVLDYDMVEQLYFLGIITAAVYNEIMALPDTPARDLKVYTFLTYYQGTLNNPIAGYTPDVEVKWTYTATEQLQDFQVFRSAEGGTLMLYKTIPVAEIALDNIYGFFDKDLKGGGRYFYQVMARHAGGGFSPRSEMKMVKVE